jgi:HSP20 family protein
MGKEDKSSPEESFFAATAAKGDSWGAEETEGQLAVDVYQTKDAVVVKAPIAGVDPEELDIVVTDDTVSIRGGRYDEKEVSHITTIPRNATGSFCQTVMLPVECDSESADATFKKGILTVRIPKAAKNRTRKSKFEQHSKR